MDPMDYIQTIILHAHGAKILKTSYQLALAVHHHIDGPQHWDIQCACKGTTVEYTIARIHELWVDWFDTYMGR